MAWYEVKLNKDGNDIPDGNNVKYPVPLPSQDDKAYKEASISAISSAIDAGPLTVAQMPEAILNLKYVGLISINIAIGSAPYTSSPLEAT
jgi:hypothetical protein